MVKRTDTEKRKTTEMWRVITAFVFLVVLLSACVIGNAPTPLPRSGPAPDFALTSSAFTEDTGIPKKYTCDGDNISPPIKWSGATSDTKSYVLTMDDRDAPTDTALPWYQYNQWVTFDFPASQTQLAEGTKSVGKSGMNGHGQIGYTGPCPPSGTTHRYAFMLIAIDIQTLGLSDGASYTDVEMAIKMHSIAATELIGTYSR